MLSQVINLKICRNELYVFLCDDFEASSEDLISKLGKSTMNVRRLRNLCVKIYKTLNDLNPSFMNNIFKLKINSREVRDKYKLNFKPATSLKLTLLHGCFSRFSNCINGTKSRNASHIIYF